MKNEERAMAMLTDETFKAQMVRVANQFMRGTIEEKIAEIQQAIYDGTGTRNRDDIRALERTLEILDL